MGKRIRTNADKQRLLDEQEELVRRALAESEATTPMRLTGPPTTAGDRMRMRGVPIQAIGVGGTLPGTQPLDEVLRKERRRGG